MRELRYKKYVGSVEVDVQSNCIHGKLLHINDLVTYEADTPAEIEDSFKAAVEDYLADCANEGCEPDTPYKGNFNVRVTPELHRELAMHAQVQGEKLNSYVVKVLSGHAAIRNTQDMTQAAYSSAMLFHGLRHVVEPELSNPRTSGNRRIVWQTEKSVQPKFSNWAKNATN